MQIEKKRLIRAGRKAAGFYELTFFREPYGKWMLRDFNPDRLTLIKAKKARQMVATPEGVATYKKLCFLEESDFQMIRDTSWGGRGPGADYVKICDACYLPLFKKERQEVGFLTVDENSWEAFY